MNNNNTANVQTKKYCTPVKVRNAFGNIDYPIDERTLAMAFIQPIVNYNNNNDDGDNENATTTTITSTDNSHTTDVDSMEQQQLQLQTGAAWLEYHLEYFLTYDDLVRIQQANVTHLRVPLPHWILYQNEDMMDLNDIWIIGKRWEYFLRLCHWARQLHLQVWPDIHTAPGSQNGFGTSPCCCVSMHRAVSSS